MSNLIVFSAGSLVGGFATLYAACKFPRNPVVIRVIAFIARFVGRSL